MLCKAFNLHKNLRDQWHLDALPSLAIIGHILVFFPFSRRICTLTELNCVVECWPWKVCTLFEWILKAYHYFIIFYRHTISNFRSLWAHIFGWNITLESTSRLLGIRDLPPEIRVRERKYCTAVNHTVWANLTCSNITLPLVSGTLGNSGKSDPSCQRACG